MSENPEVESGDDQEAEKPRTFISTRTLLMLGIGFVIFGAIMVIFFPDA